MKICKGCGWHNENEFIHCTQCGAVEFKDIARFAMPPLPQAGIHCLQKPPLLNQSKTGSYVFLKICAVLIILLLFSIVIALWSGGGNSSGNNPGQSDQDAGLTAREKSAIESVSQKDSTTCKGVTSVGEVVNRMRVIDMSGCPNDFRAAYLANIHAWEQLAVVEQEAIQFKHDSSSAGAYAEAFIRGFLGDPLGKAKEENAAQSEIQKEASAAIKQVQQTYQRVEEVAVGYGADLLKQ